ncbi:MAG: hypothetical protein ACK5FE_10340 [Cyanobacteriota bacterium]|jgi:hypothetical protein
MVARLRLLVLPALLVSVLPLLGNAAAWAESPSAPASRCNNATLKGTYLYSSIGMLDGKPYAESGREVYDGKGGVELTFQGTGGATGTMRTTYSVSPDCIGKAVYPYGQSLMSFISPDGSRFTYTITRGPGERPTALSGWEIRVDP